MMDEVKLYDADGNAVGAEKTKNEEAESAVEIEEILDIPGIDIKIKAKNVYLTIYPAGYLGRCEE